MHRHLSFNTQPLKSKDMHNISLHQGGSQLPPTGLLTGDDTLEQVDCYHYLGILETSEISQADHIQHN